MCHNDETWDSYTLPKEDTKNTHVTWHTPWVLLTSAFFQQKFLYRDIQKKAEFWFLFSDSFDSCLVYKGCFNQNDSNFDDASKPG